MFKKHLLNFSVSLVALTIIIAVIGYGLFSYLGLQICKNYFIDLLLLFTLTTFAFHSIFLYIFTKNPSKFFPTFMISTVVKIFVYMIFLVIYIFTIKDSIKCFLVSFLLLYLLYTFFEVIILTRYTRNNNLK
jgi:predicted neutral ceramidase superfamily lipid hydrolase